MGIRWIMWLLIIIVPSLKEVNHKILLAGHTHMEADGEYSIQIQLQKFETSLWIQQNINSTIIDRVNIMSSSNKKPTLDGLGWKLEWTMS